MRLYWLSFCDGDRPTGQQFLGAVVVEVTEADRDAARPWAEQRRGAPLAVDSDAAWLAGALRVSWRLGVNPGGEVAYERLDGWPDAPLYPRGRLMDRATLARFERAQRTTH